ncbi:MAG: hypothetical protein HN855_12225 [Anaerolineae bacterium]|jgi:hypothetical protein|nr:hypothetical protein [Anaerolineae bacterium]MBT7071296.1 hypothetical protein [Anaerolineae bacterium]MBT7325920.1 hypothetical protein [Anaerolineae bacterium]
MKNKKYEILETMLENIFEHGADIEGALGEYPEYADELRPLLQAALDSKMLGSIAVPDDIAHRGRARLLQHVAQMRDAAPAPRAPLFDFRLASVALGLVLVFFVSGSGLVRVSASALPGESLYPVKLGWESTRFWFAGADKTASLKVEFEEERREEVRELLGMGQLAAIRFEGVVTSLNGSKWEVAGVPVILSADAQVDVAISIGTDVIVSGQTQSDGTVLASEIVLSGHSSEDHEEIPTANVEDNLAEEPEETETPDEGDEGSDDDEDTTPSPEPEDGDDSSDGDSNDGDEEEESSDETSTPVPDDDDHGDEEESGNGTPTATPTPMPDEGDEEDDDD